MNPETALKSALLLAHGARPGIRLFNNPVGHGWIGREAERTRETVTLLHPRQVKFGLCPGSADIIGWRSVVITPDMVGTTIARFVAPEVKTANGRLSDDQRRFLTAAGAAGGLAGIVRSSDDLADLLDGRVLL